MCNYRVCSVPSYTVVYHNTITLRKRIPPAYKPYPKNIHHAYTRLVNNDVQSGNLSSNQFIRYSVSMILTIYIIADALRRTCIYKFVFLLLFLCVRSTFKNVRWKGALTGIFLPEGLLLYDPLALRNGLVRGVPFQKHTTHCGLPNTKNIETREYYSILREIGSFLHATKRT